MIKYNGKKTVYIYILEVAIYYYLDLYDNRIQNILLIYTTISAYIHRSTYIYIYRYRILRSKWGEERKGYLGGTLISTNDNTS